MYLYTCHSKAIAQDTVWPIIILDHIKKTLLEKVVENGYTIRANIGQYYTRWQAIQEQTQNCKNSFDVLVN